MAITDSGLGLTYSSTYTTAPDLHFLIGDFYTNVLQDARNNSNPVMGLLPNRKRRVSGKAVIETVRYGRNVNAFNAVRQGGKFPDPGTQKSRMMSLFTRTIFLRFSLDGWMLRANEGEATRSLDVVANHIANTMEDFELDEGRMMHNDGSGRVAELIKTSSSVWNTPLVNAGFSASVFGAADLTANSQSTMTVGANSDVGTAQGATVGGTASVLGAPNMPGTAYFEVNGRYAIVSSGGTIRGVIRVDAVQNDYTLQVTNTGSGTITYAGLADGDWIVKIGNDDSGVSINDSAFRREPIGLGGMFGYTGILDGNGPAAEVGTAVASIADGTTAYTWSGTEDYTTTNKYFFQGLPANSSATSWAGDLAFNQAIVNNNAGAARKPTEALLQRFLTYIKRANNATPTYWLSSPEVRDTYFETLLPEKRYMSKAEMKGGWDVEAGGPGGIPWVADIRCWRNRAYAMALEDGDFEMLEYEPLRWASAKGSPIWTYLQDTDIYQGRMVADCNYKVGVRNRLGGVMLDLLES